MSAIVFISHHSKGSLHSICFFPTASDASALDRAPHYRRRRRRRRRRLRPRGGIGGLGDCRGGGQRAELGRRGRCIHVQKKGSSNHSKVRTGLAICSDSWVGLTLILAVPPSAWADRKLADLAEQLGKMVEYHRSQSTLSHYPSRCLTLYRVTHQLVPNLPLT